MKIWSHALQDLFNCAFLIMIVTIAEKLRCAGLQGKRTVKQVQRR